MPTLMYRVPKVTVELADSRKREYATGSGAEGFFFYDQLSEMAQAGKLQNSFFPANTLLQFGTQDVPHIVPVNRTHLKGLLLRPVYRQPIPCLRFDDTPQRRWGVETSTGAPYYPTPVGTEHNDFWDRYSFLPNNRDYWDFTLREDGLLYDMSQNTSYETNGETLDDWMTSQVSFMGPVLPDIEGNVGMGQAPNPFFTVGFRRQALSQLFLQCLGAARVLNNREPLVGTSIAWGGMHVTMGDEPEDPEDPWPATLSSPYGKWMLWCPPTGKPRLYEWVGNDWPWGPNQVGHFVPRDWTEGDLSEITAEKAADKGYTYHIGTMGHAICVSEGGFDGDGGFAYYLVENASEPVVPSGQILVNNFPGQFTCWLDLNVFPVGTVTSWPKYAPSFSLGAVESRILGQPFSTVINDNTTLTPQEMSDLPLVEGMAATLVGPRTLEDYQLDDYLQYSLQISAGQYPSGGDALHDVFTQTPPFVEAVQLWQDPTLTDNGTPTFTETDRQVADIDIEGELEGQQHIALTVSNREPGYTPPAGDEPAGGWSPTRDWTVGRGLKITHAGWEYQDLDGGADVSAGQVMGNWWIAAPTQDVAEAHFDLISLMGWLELAQWEGETDLCFRSWRVADAIMFCLAMNDIGAHQYDLEDLFTVPDSLEFRHGRGKSWGQVIKSLVGVDSRSEGWEQWGGRGGAIWEDLQDGKIKTGCRYCRTKRTTSDWLTHCDNGWNSSGCLAADAVRVTGGIDAEVYLTPTETWNRFSDPLVPDPMYPYSILPAWDFKSEVTALDPRDYANSITVVGATRRRDVLYVLRGKLWRDGRVVREQTDDAALIGHWRNPVALDYTSEDVPDYLPFKISRVETDESLTTQQDVDARGAQLASRMSPRARKIRFTTPMAVALKPGMAMRMHGGKFAEADEKKHRITGVRHNPRNGTTDVSAREMIALPTT